MKESLKGSGTMTRDTEEATNDIPMRTYTKVNLSLAKLMEKVDINGVKVEKYTMENGQKA